MRLGKLGEQFVLKSPAAFEKIQFISYEIADNIEYYAKRKVRDDKARAAFRAELVMDVFTKSGIRTSFPQAQVDYDYSPQYWCGWILAYYQWYTGRSFKEMSKVLGCRVEDLLEYDTEEIENTNR